LETILYPSLTIPYLKLSRIAHARLMLQMRGIVIAILTISLLVFFIPNLHTISTPVTATTAYHPWSLTITITDSNNNQANVTFGKTLNSTDGKDAEDIALPPSPPQPPFIRSWFQTTFGQPYTMLWDEYKSATAITSIWNLSVLFVPAPGDTSATNLTLRWDPVILSTNLASCKLVKNETTIANMTSENSYTFTSPGNLATFQIITIEKPSLMGIVPAQIILLVILAVIIVAISVYFLRKRR
jgi:hypothetical protein